MPSLVLLPLLLLLVPLIGLDPFVLVPAAAVMFELDFAAATLVLDPLRLVSAAAVPFELDSAAAVPAAAVPVDATATYNTDAPTLERQHHH